MFGIANLNRLTADSRPMLEIENWIEIWTKLQNRSNVPGTSLISVSSPPASISSTVQFRISDNRDAITAPAEPAPTTMKSYWTRICEKRENKKSVREID